jgi:hypothetical protein
MLESQIEGYKSQIMSFELKLKENGDISTYKNKIQVLECEVSCVQKKYEESQTNFEAS